MMVPKQQGKQWMMRVPVAGRVVLVMVLSCWSAADAAQRFVDLTYTFDETTQVWPANPPFHRDSTEQGGTPTEKWYATGQVALSEHAGTHMDAPVHFAQGQAGIDGIPVDRLIGPAVVIDVRVAVKEDRDYRASLSDIHRWESAHRTIPAGAIVMLLTGWGVYWTDRERYFGSATPDCRRRCIFRASHKKSRSFWWRNDTSPESESIQPASTMVLPGILWCTGL